MSTVSQCSNTETPSKQRYPRNDLIPLSTLIDRWSALGLGWEDILVKLRAHGHRVRAHEVRTYYFKRTTAPVAGAATGAVIPLGQGAET